MPTRTYYNEFFEKELTVYESFTAGYDYDKMLEHVAAHRENGDYIPEYVDELLIFERDCVHDFNDEAICKHCWVRDEI